MILALRVIVGLKELIEPTSANYGPVCETARISSKFVIWGFRRPEENCGRHVGVPPLPTEAGCRLTEPRVAENVSVTDSAGNVNTISGGLSPVREARAVLCNKVALATALSNSRKEDGGNPSPSCVRR